MRGYRPFSKDKNWYKGNLHCHSTNSDGKRSPEDAIAMYKKAGYDFIAFSEHNLYTNHAELSNDDFLLIPAIEISADEDRSLKGEHILGFERPQIEEVKRFTHGEFVECPIWEGKSTLQKLVNNLNDHGMNAMICHPLGSREECDDINNIDNVFALEIFNSYTESNKGRGVATTYWDEILRSGTRVWGVASDDAHKYNFFDTTVSFIMVKADSLNFEGINKALEAGEFYSSNGPRIRDFYIEDGVCHVECSPVKSIYFITYETRGGSVHAKQWEILDSASYKLKGDEDYVRVECVDEFGRCAWSNPIFLKDK